MKIFSPILKGTTTVAQGTTNLSGSFTGSLFGTAATASYADNFTVGGTLTAQTINVQIITSSIEFNTGSTRNGALSTNTHQFTGSVSITGSAAALLNVNNGVLYVSASGNVGIGTSTITAWNGNQGTIVSQFSSGNSNTIYSLQTNASSVDTGGIFEAFSANTTNLSKALGSIAFLRQNTSTTALSSYTGFYTNNAGSVDERMRITSAGNVGIGTTGPSASLHITNTSTGVVTDGLMLHNNGNSGTAGNGVRLIFKCGSFTSTEYRSYATIEGVTDGANNPSIALVFKTPNYGILFPPNERMRITGGGDVLVGTTTSGVLASANGITLNAGGMIYVNSDNPSIFNRSTNSSGTIMQFRYNEATVVGTITITSSATAYNTSSDYRLKEDLKPINGLDKVSALNVYDFKWKSSDDRMDGFLAHELQEVIPYAVTGIKDGEEMQGVDYSKIVPVLVKAIQELKSENDTLKEILQRNNIQ